MAHSPDAHVPGEGRGGGWGSECQTGGPPCFRKRIFKQGKCQPDRTLHRRRYVVARQRKRAALELGASPLRVVKSPPFSPTGVVLWQARSGFLPTARLVAICTTEAGRYVQPFAPPSSGYRREVALFETSRQPTARPNHQGETRTKAGPRHECAPRRWRSHRRAAGIGARRRLTAALRGFGARRQLTAAPWASAAAAEWATLAAGALAAGAPRPRAGRPGRGGRRAAPSPAGRRW